MVHDIAVEQALLGSILLRNEVFGAVSGRVSADDYYEPIHQQIHNVLSALISKGKLANAITVRPFIPADVTIADGVTAQQYVARLMAEGAIATEAPHLADLVRDMADRRRIAEIAVEVQRLEATDPAESAAWAIEQLDGIVASRSGSNSPTVTMGQSVQRALEASASAFEMGGKMTGLTMGLSALDSKIRGAQKTQLIVVGGRPSSGKTSLAMSISKSMAEAGARGIVFSLEMNDVELSQRMISDEIYDHGKPIPYIDIRNGNYNQDQFIRIQDAARRIENLPIKIDQTPNLSVGQMAARARQMKRRGGLDFIVIDHLGFVKTSGRTSSRNEAVGEITASLKGLAKELEVPIILLCQLSRGVESREDKRPQMSDLRDSGNIEQDADVVMMVYREAYYLERKEPPIGTAENMVWAEKMDAVYQRMDVIVEKNRMGPIGAARLFCDVKSNAIRDEGYKPGQSDMPEMEF